MTSAITDASGRQQRAGWSLSREQAEAWLKKDRYWGGGNVGFDEITIQKILQATYESGYYIVEMAGSKEWMAAHSITKFDKDPRCERCGMEQSDHTLCRHGHEIYIIDLTSGGFNALHEISTLAYYEGSLFAKLTPEERNTINSIILNGMLREKKSMEDYLANLERPKT